jgi:hypothetical protein
MNYLGVRVLASALYCAVIDSEGYLVYKYARPVFFDTKKDIVKVINFYRDNIISVLSQHKIDAAAVKKTEPTSIQGRGLEDGRRVQLYSEGMVIATIGSFGKICRDYYTNNMKYLYRNDFSEMNIQDIAHDVGLDHLDGGIPDNDDYARDAFVSAICCMKEHNQ